MSAQRRFLWRWNRRVLLAEWRQYAVMFTMIFVAVMLSVAGLLAAVNLAAAPSEYGGGNAIADFPDAATEAEFESRMDARGWRYGRIETAKLTVEGTVQTVDARVQDPANPISGPLIGLVEGRYPTTADEIAVSARSAIGDTAIGATTVLGGQSLTVVGIVENPRKLSEGFALLTDLDGFGLDAEQRFAVYYAEGSIEDSEILNNLPAGVTSGELSRGFIAIAVNVVSAFAMLLIALLVGAGFAVITARRTRQYGLLAAAGAPPSTIRTSATVSGLLLGLAAAVTGAVAGFAVGLLLVPAMESAVDHRIDLAIPWPSAIVMVAMAVLTAALAARWPTRALSKQPVVNLLSSMRPRPEPAGRAAIVGVALSVIGVMVLTMGFRQENASLAMLGVVLAPIGLLLTAPLLVAGLGRLAARLPMAFRLAGRSVARHSRRSGAIVAALALAVAIPIGIAVASSSVEGRAVAEGPNLPETMMMLRMPGTEASRTLLPAQPDTAAMTTAAERVGQAAPGLALLPVEVATSAPRGTPDDPDYGDFVTELPGLGRQTVVDLALVAGRPGSNTCFLDCETWGFNDTVWHIEPTWIATPELLAAFDLDADWLATDVPAIARTAEQAVVGNNGRVGLDREPAVVSGWPMNASVPALLVAPGLVDDLNLETTTIGWLAISENAITSETRQAVLNAAGGDLVAEFHEPLKPRSSLRWVAALLGMVIGLGIAVSAVGLFTAELRGDLRLLRSIGASPRWTRRLSAAMAAILAFAGALIGLFIGYVALVPLLSISEADFPFVVPWRTLLAFLVALPAATALVAWSTGASSGSGAAQLEPAR